MRLSRREIKSAEQQERSPRGAFPPVSFFISLAAEPSALISIEQGLGGPWGIVINVGFGNYWNSARQQRYDQALYAAQLEYTLKHNQSMSLGCWSICPNDLPGTRKGVNVMRLDLRYAINPNVKTQYSIHVTRGMSPVDRDWGVLLGVGREL